MKKILSKVMTLILIGSALTFASCNKDYENDLNQLRDDMVSQLEDQNQALLDAIETAKQEAIAHADAAAEAAKDYAEKVAAAEAAAAKAEAIAESNEYTDAQVAKALEEAIAAAKTFADEALEAANKYADEAAEAAYLRAHNEMLDHVQKECEKTLSKAKTYTDEQIKKLDGELRAEITRIQKILQDQIDQNTLDITELYALAAGLRTDLDALRAEYNQFVIDTNAAIKRIDDALVVVNGRLDTLEDDMAQAKEDIKKAQNDIKNLQNSLKALEERVTKEVERLDGRIDALDVRMKDAEDAIDALEARMDTAEQDIENLEIRMKAAEEEITNLWAEIEKVREEMAQMKKDLMEMIENLDIKQSKRLTSITLIPENYVDGIPSILVEAMYYLPKDIADDETFVEDNQLMAAPYKDSKVGYHLSPAHITDNGIEGAPTLLYKDARYIETRAAEHIEYLTVVKGEVNEATNEYELTVRRNSTKEMYHSKEQFRDSVYTAALRLEIAKELLAKDEKEAYVTSEYSSVYEVGFNYPYIVRPEDHDNLYAGTYDDAKKLAKNELQDKVVDYSETLDMNTIVEPGVWTTNAQWDILTAERMAELGYEIQFVKPADQKFYNMDENGVISATGREALGKAAIVRVMLVDTRCTEDKADDLVMDARWVVVRWGLVNDRDLGVVYDDFVYEMNCIDPHFELTSAQFQSIVLDQIEKYGVDEEDFDNWYIDEFDVNPGTASYYYSYGVSKFVWDIQINNIDEIVEKLKKGEEPVVEGKFTAKPEEGYSFSEYITAKIDFQINFTIKLPADMPTVNPDNFREHGWQVNQIGQLARVAPIAFVEGSYTDGDIVAYDFDMLNELFLTQPIVKNILNQTTPEKACRAWDIVFRENQPAAFAYNTAHSLNLSTTEAIADINITFNPALTNTTWFNQNAESIKLAVHNSANAKTVLNDFDNTDRRFNVDIVAKINEHYIFAAHQFEMYIVNPVNVPVPAPEKYEFEDNNYHESSIDVRNAFDEMEDFLFNPIVAYEQDALGMELDRRHYYGVQDPEWLVDEAIWTKDYESDVRPEAANGMQHTGLTLTFRNRELVYKNNSNNYLSEPIAIWVPVVVEHEWDAKVQWVKFTVVPSKEVK